MSLKRAFLFTKLHTMDTKRKYSLLQYCKSVLHFYNSKEWCKDGINGTPKM